ncbi:MAG: TonB-dependent receptor, partial [Saprospiraceae bacterium]|nr:TonB-dependent receptor [Saprospiraceae bacterium]
QFDNKIAEKLRITWGVRMENFSQRLQSIDYTNAPVDVNKTVLNMLPSLNLTYALNEKNQLRFSASQTVTRPEFREIAPFSFYDFNLNAAILGNPKLEPGKIANIDLRYELYPGSNQLFSVSAFAKKFDNPIEFAFFSQGAGTRTFTFQNLPSATTYGVETEIRKNLGFIIPNGENWVVFSNLAILHSKLDFKGIGYYDAKRPLQGQSPYVFNAGLTYQAPFGLSSTVVFNMIGDRISQVGTADPNTGEGYADIYERRRQLLDLSVSQRIARRGEVKLTFSDLLRPDFIFYQDNNRNHKYDEANDNIMQRVHVGTTANLSFSWKF